jgi:hypothetical protein
MGEAKRIEVQLDGRYGVREMTLRSAIGESTHETLRRVLEALRAGSCYAR